MPKLLQINSTANWGSTGKIAEQIGELAIQHGWQSYIAYGRSCNTSSSELIKIGSKLSQAWHLLISRLFDRHGLGSRYATKQLIKRIKQINPDVIHLHNIHGYYINYELLFDYLNSVTTPVVWTLHDCWSFTGHCAHFVEAGCMKWIDACRNCPARCSYPKALIDCSHNNFRRKQRYFTSLNNRLTLVPVSKWLSEQAMKSYLRNSHIQYIYNGVDTNIFSARNKETIRSKYNIGNSYLCVSVASSWSRAKGLDDLIALRQTLPSNYVIMVVGLSDSVGNELPEGMIAIPRTQSQVELAEIYSAADVVISTSKQETFGLTIAEGMACGTPAIVYNTTALPELITQQTGIVVEQLGNISTLAEAVVEICERGKGHYSEACRRHAVDNFDKNKCFDRYLQLYSELTK